MRKFYIALNKINYFFKVLEICKLLVEKNSNLLLTTDEIMKVTRGRMDEKTIS